jgi:hypothetical protein
MQITGTLRVASRFVAGGLLERLSVSTALYDIWNAATQRLKGHGWTIAPGHSTPGEYL